MTIHLANIPQVAWAFVAVPAFVLFWCGLLWLIGAWGWRQFAQVYPDRLAQATRTWRWRSIRFAGGANYGNCVNISASNTGLRLSVLPLFRIGHPPIFIPWTDLSISRSSHWFGTSVQLRARRVSRAILLSGRLADAIAAQVGAAWRENVGGHLGSPVTYDLPRGAWRDLSRVLDDCRGLRIPTLISAAPTHSPGQRPSETFRRE